AVIGDGAFPSGIVFEAMNNAGGLKKKLLVVLNDNKMSICPRTGGLADMFDRMRTTRFYTGVKTEVVNMLDKVPIVGESVERFLSNFKEAIKAGLHGGMLFEELGFRYIGPIDGHDIRQMRKYLAKVKRLKGPVLLHVVTEKGHGFRPAAEDPVYFHTPAPFTRANGQLVPIAAAGGGKAYTNIASQAIEEQMAANSRVTVLTAAMCQGTKLEKVRDRFPDRFFDTGICEEHTVAFAAGMAKAGMRPIVDIYSTFLQRAYDQIFQEVTLQNLPVTFLLDRAGITGADGPTHHGMFDLGYLRVFPNLAVLAPGDSFDLPAMLDWALKHDGAAAIRYPKATAETIAPELVGGEREPIVLGRAEVMRTGRGGTIIACGTLLSECIKAAETLSDEGLDVSVINARFVKPLDTDTILRALRESPFVVTVEEGCLMGGFGSAVLEAAADAELPAGHLYRAGIPDRFIEHGDRDELLGDLRLDAAGIAATCRRLAARAELSAGALPERGA
ncbi:MAG: 1-deoxy-D-xylulose-5-phosphate synthase, partial [Planctomycetia bacterium]|nr:1-deoxy-D-xylulose-5-phosphate synthase [Planctomycetia bacterium]